MGALFAPTFIQYKVMRKLLFLLLFLPLALFSQSKFGYFNYTTVLDSLPQYKEAMDNYDKLKKRCMKEIEHNEQELTRFYVAFLDGHREFPEPILRKRQKELQQMIDNSVVFRDQLKVWLRHAKDSLSVPSRQLVDSAVQTVCIEQSLMYAINIDRGEYRYINSQFGVDITEEILAVLQRPADYVPADSVIAVDSVDVATGEALAEEIPATLRIPATLIDNYSVDSVAVDSLKKDLQTLPVTEKQL